MIYFLSLLWIMTTPSACALLYANYKPTLPHWHTRYTTPIVYAHFCVSWLTEVKEERHLLPNKHVCKHGEPCHFKKIKAERRQEP